MKSTMAEIKSMTTKIEPIDPQKLLEASRRICKKLADDGFTARCPKLWKKMIEMYLMAKNGKLDKGVIFASGTGAGKTYCLQLLTAMQESPFEIYDAVDIRDLFVDDRNKFNKLAKKEVHLIIDDLGAELPYNDYGIVTEVMIEFIQHRYRIWRKTGYTTSFATNMDNDGISNRYKDERIYDRLFHMCEGVGTTIKSQRGI